MKTSNLNRGLGCLLTALLLAACQGQNPIKSSADLAQDYPNAMRANVSADGPQEPLPPKPDNDQLYCLAMPFVAEVENDQGDLDLTFTEGTSGSYKLNVSSLWGSDDAVKLVDSKGPAGAKITGKNGQYVVSWTPAVGKFDQKPEIFELQFSSPKTEKCNGGPVNLSLVTYHTRQNPTVSFVGLPQTALKFGESAKFQVLVQDPAATDEVTPILTRIFLRRDAITSQNGKVDGSKAVDCKMENPALHKEHGYLFDCSFESSLIKDIKGGSLVDAVFYVEAQSQRNGRTSAPVPGHVNVQFEVVKTVAAPAPTEELEIAGDLPEFGPDKSQAAPKVEVKPVAKKGKKR